MRAILRFVWALWVAAGSVPTLAQDQDRPIRAVGAFSNMRFTEEHAYGYTVELWRDGDSIVGLFLASEGLQGDTPTGQLENVRFNPRTGALSFTARLTMGVVLLPGGGQEPSRDQFRFSGTLKPTVLTGTVLRSDARQPSSAPSGQSVELKIQPQAVSLPARTYAEWRDQMAGILKRRGPKW